jgi:hypothetical protein
MSRPFYSITSAQQQIALAVARGSHFWIAGEVAIENYPRLVEKFAEKYGTELSRGRRGYRRDRGLANATLLACPIGGRVSWWLLLTEGKHPAHMHETVRDARGPGQRLTFGQDYVLIHSTRIREHGGGSRWTWFLTRESEMGESRSLAKLAQQGDAGQVRNFCDTLLHRPLHSGIRTQTARMLRRAKVIWHRHHAPRPWPGADPSNLPIMTFKLVRQSADEERDAAFAKLKHASFAARGPNVT